MKKVALFLNNEQLQGTEISVNGMYELLKNSTKKGFVGIYYTKELKENNEITKKTFATIRVGDEFERKMELAQQKSGVEVDRTNTRPPAYVSTSLLTCVYKNSGGLAINYSVISAKSTYFYKGKEYSFDQLKKINEMHDILPTEFFEPKAKVHENELGEDAFIWNVAYLTTIDSITIDKVTYNIVEKDLELRKMELLKIAHEFGKKIESVKNASTKLKHYNTANDALKEFNVLEINQSTELTGIIETIKNRVVEPSID